MIDLLRASLKTLRTDKRGVVALEYGLMAAVIVGAVALGFGLLGNAISTQFATIGTSL